MTQECVLTLPKCALRTKAPLPSTVRPPCLDALVHEGRRRSPVRLIQINAPSPRLAHSGAMNTTLAAPALAPLRILAAAPHRLMFFIGAMNVLLAMAWWALWLVDTRWHVFGLEQPAIPAGWLHAIVMQYQVLPSFMFGFLLTVFPRWMNQSALTRAHYVPVGIGLFGGQALTLIGIAGGLPFLKAGAILTIAGWIIGMMFLVRILIRDEGKTWHATSCAFALGFGLLGFVMYTVFLYRFDARVMFVSMKIGGLALLLPIYFTVCHRMIPFFTSCVIKNYRAYRPMWTLAGFWMLTMLHLWLELRHAYTLLWIVDVPMMLLGVWLLANWYPRGQTAPALLKVLFAGFAWLPIAFALYAFQSIWFATTGEFVLGRGPAHALFIGFFGSLLVAMVTRVTQGHSGRPLVLGNVAGFAFIVIQLIAITRIAAEIAPDMLACQAVAALGWLLAFTPWVVRSGWIYLTPRRDGAPG